MKRVSASLAALVLLGGTWLPAQQQGDRPVFRAGVELIQLDVSVLDGRRQPVRGLTAADFTVLEDGVPRPVRAFTVVNLPGRERHTAAWIDAVPPDVATNQIGEQDGRIVVILMDRSIPAATWLATSPSGLPRGTFRVGAPTVA
jgi:hypothetical protein